MGAGGAATLNVPGNYAFQLMYAPADAGLDKDGDGQSNLDEYLADIDLSDPSSRFQVKRLADTGNPAIIRVRFPENINSELGLHFLDNLQPELPRVSKVALPDWQTDPEAGALFYQVKTAEGIGFAGRVRVEGSSSIWNTPSPTALAKRRTSPARCASIWHRPRGLNERITLDHAFTWIGGDYHSLTTTTSPKREAKFAKNGFNWLLMLYNEQPNDQMRKIEDDCFWWIGDQKPDLRLVARETADGKHLVAITWEKSTVRRLMTNTNISCLHADPLECKNLPPGESRTWRGRVFMMKNNPSRLLEVFNRLRQAYYGGGLRPSSP